MPLQIDAFNKLIQVTSPDTEVDAQTLHDFVEDYMASPLGMVTDGATSFKGDILKPEGKIEDPSNPGVFSQIILILNPEWQIQFWPGSGYGRIYGGKIVGGVGDEPLKATGTAGDISVLESPVDGVTVNVGSGLSASEQTMLTEIWRRLALDIANPLTNKSDGGITATDINITATPSGDDIVQTRS